MLRGSARLRRREDFTATMRSGTKASRGSLVLYLRCASGSEPSRPVRCGFVVSKAVGGSVVRHRVTRQLRHLCADHLSGLPAGATLVVRATPRAADRGFPALRADFESGLARLAPKVSA